MDTTVIAFYKFFTLAREAVPVARETLLSAAKGTSVRGLILVSEEGINGTIAASAEDIARYKDVLEGIAGQLTYKESQALSQPFKRFIVKIRKEIVAIGDPSMHPTSAKDSSHISPDEWDTMIESGDAVIIDTRNDYETAIGMFEGAIDPHIKTFQEFPAYIQKASIPKEKTVLLYCTGGIRCEKAVLAMKKEGYPHVYQLHGGILQYLKERKGGKFWGECFVFDHRVAVDAALRPSEKYALCPHCGDPGDIRITCERCSSAGTVCKRCVRACSKDCAYHLARSRNMASSHAS